MEPQNTAKTVFWLGETLGFWIQTGALIISAVVGVLVILSRSRSERRRATVDLVLHQKRDSELIQAKRKLLELHDAGEKNFARFLDKNTPEYSTIIKILNTHEFVSAGIREKAYDEQLYKRMQCSTMLRDWDALSGFVTEFRKQQAGKYKNSKTFYQDFEGLARKWEKNPLKPTND